MKYLYLNLKRFDVPSEYGGVNSIAPIQSWAQYIISATQQDLKRYSSDDVKFIDFFPEAHMIEAVGALDKDSPICVGCQGVYRANVAVGGNFGAFTTNRPAIAMKAIGASSAIIGHCEERADIAGIISEAGGGDYSAINRILNQEVIQAVNSGMQILYCVGEKEEEQPRWREVLREQLEIGLFGVDRKNVVIGYEPVWSIGPGKSPADKPYITKIAQFIKEVTDGLPVVYGGGLKKDNAGMLASIEEIDGGLIALTRFSGNIGFYPDEYLEIINTYLEK